MAHRERDDPNAPRVAAAGPLLSTIDFWLNLPAERQFIHLKDPDAARTGVKYLAARGADAVKIWFIVTPDQTVEASTPAVLAAARRRRDARPPAHRARDGSRRGEGRAEGRRASARPQRGRRSRSTTSSSPLAKANRAVYCPTLTVVGGYARLARAIARRTAPTIDDPNGCVDAATRAQGRRERPAPDRGRGDAPATAWRSESRPDSRRRWRRT